MQFFSAVNPNCHEKVINECLRKGGVQNSVFRRAEATNVGDSVEGFTQLHTNKPFLKHNVIRIRKIIDPRWEIIFAPSSKDINSSVLTPVFGLK